MTIPVEEGQQFKAGEVTFSGDMIVPEETVREQITIKTGEIFSKKVVREDIQKLVSLYADHGYAFASVSPMIDEKTDNLTVDIDYRIEKKDLVYFDRISIVGNTKTRDNVIRRELDVIEGDLFTAQGLRDSQNHLQRLGYFDEVNITNSQGSDDNTMDLRVDVKERPTGAFAVGAGYGSFNKLFATARISQNNLFGKGQKLSLQGTFGGATTDYTLSFTEPWLYDRPLAVGFDLYDRDTDYDAYDKHATGLVMRAGYPVFKDTRLTGSYKYEEIRISNITDNAATIIQEMKGDSTSSTLTSVLERDTRNNYFNPTEGSDNVFSVEYAGGILGGTNYYTRYVVDSGWYFPMPMKEHAFFVRGKAGLVTKREGGDLPAYEKFYLGGINSLRGYEWSSVSPKDPATGTQSAAKKCCFLILNMSFPWLKVPVWLVSCFSIRAIPGGKMTLGT